MIRFDESERLHIRIGDAIEQLYLLPRGIAQCCVTSPPYFGLRDYGHKNQIGLEATPQEYVAKLVEVFRHVRRILKHDGVLWLNLGDSYASGEVGRHDSTQGRKIDGKRVTSKATFRQQTKLITGIPPKNLLGIPWRVAFALQDDGWILRSDCIWHKPSAMPESVKDRPSKSHEYLFMLAVNPNYYYDGSAIEEMAVTGGKNRRYAFCPKYDPLMGRKLSDNECKPYDQQPLRKLTRKKRTVWSVPTYPYSGAHFATFPPKLIEPCVLSSSRTGDYVLDPFIGSGTTAQVALSYGRKAVGIDLNPDNLKLIQERCAQICHVTK